MKNCILALAALLVLVSVAAEGGPVEKVSARLGLTLPPYRRLVESRLFAANERAKVIAIGQDGSSNLGLYVYDQHGNCVGWDDLGSSSTRDDVVVEWFPMQIERYTIELRNLGAATNKLDIVVR